MIYSSIHGLHMFGYLPIDQIRILDKIVLTWVEDYRIIYLLGRISYWGTITFFNQIALRTIYYLVGNAICIFIFIYQMIKYLRFFTISLFGFLHGGNFLLFIHHDIDNKPSYSNSFWRHRYNLTSFQNT